jgi:hypothetical protein
MSKNGGESVQASGREPGGEKERTGSTQTRDRMRSLLSSLPSRAPAADSERYLSTRCNAGCAYGGS